MARATTGAAGNAGAGGVAFQVVTCTRSDPLEAAASYPVITLTVNVAANASGSVINTATVAGGGETNTANNSAADLTAFAGGRT